MKNVKSARGEIVNFDLIKIKEQMAAAPKTVDVKNRENFIEQRNKRRMKKLSKTAVAMAEVAVEPKIVNENTVAEESNGLNDNVEQDQMLLMTSDDDHEGVDEYSDDADHQQIDSNKKQHVKRITK